MCVHGRGRFRDKSSNPENVYNNALSVIYLQYYAFGEPLEAVASRINGARKIPSAEPEFGREDATCQAMSVLESLSMDMDIREEQVQEEEEVRAPMRSMV